MIDYAKRYDKQVIHGDRITDKDVRQACRFDLIERKKSVKDKSYPYYYDLGVADKYVNLARLLSPQKLASFQLAFISMVNGWRLKSNPKVRRYQEALYTMARKNAKSYVASLMLCSELLLGELEHKTNNQLYIVATNKKQSLLTLNQSKDMIKRIQQKSEIARNFKITQDMIYSTVTGSRIEALSNRPGALNGLNPTVVDVDEVEAMKDDKLIQVIKSSMALQGNGLTLLTSTAGFILSSPVRTEWKTCESALKNHDLNSRILGYIYTQDNRKEIFDNPKSWIKSNPLMEVPKVKQVMMPYLKEQLHTASIMKTTNSTITKNFNKFGNMNDKSFIDPDKWKANTVKPISLYNRSNVILGCDLSHSRDLTSISIVVPFKDNNYYTDTTSFVPTGDMTIEAKSKADGIDYKALDKLGVCHVCKDYGFVPDDKAPDYILKLTNKYHWEHVFIGYDDWASDQLVTKLGDDNRFTIVKVKQNPSTLSPVIINLYKLIVSHRLLHKNNILYDYGFHNIEMVNTFTGLPYFNKHRNVEKIDNVFSLLDALKLAPVVKKNEKRPKLSDALKEHKSIF